MYTYVGDKHARLVHGLEPRDYPDDELLAMPDETAWLVRTSPQWAHKADRPARAEAAPQDKPGDGKG